VLVLPSDHFVEREVVLRGSLERAFDEAERAPGQVVLLGITPERADPEYGWMVLAEPGARGPDAAAAPRRVESFAEKPDRIEAERLMSHGALWSSFIFAATAGALLGIFRALRPGLLRGFLARARAAAWNPAVPLDLEGLPAVDFSRDLLERSSRDLRVLAVPACGWTDLGTPGRVAAWQERHAAALSS
jgi:mannose-1-phosphate guanylyltransferase